MEMGNAHALSMNLSRARLVVRRKHQRLDALAGGTKPPGGPREG